MSEVRIEMLRDALLPELRLALGLASGKSKVEVLNTMHLEASPGKFLLETTNLNVGYRRTLPAKVEGSGALCLNAKKFTDIIANMPESAVTLLLGERDGTVVTERSSFRLPGIMPEKFPMLQGVQGEKLVLSTPLVLSMIERVAYAISAEESRYTINGAVLETDGSNATLAATDARRLAVVEVPLNNPPRLSSLISREAIRMVARMLAGLEGECEIRHHGSHVFFDAGGRQISALRLTGAFPNYHAVIPTKFCGTAEVPASLLLGALRRVALMADEPSQLTKLLFAENALRVEASSSEFGQAREDIPISYSGPDLQLGFNAKHLEDFLAVTGNARVCIQFKDESSASRWTVLHNGGGPPAYDYQYVVMPLRVYGAAR